MKDIADIFGVSTVTVSKALGGKDGVSETLRSQIKNKAAELGYYQHTVARSKGLGVLVPERYFGANAFYSRFYSEVSIAAADRGAFTILEIVSTSDEQRHTSPKLLNMADGVIFLGQFSDRYINAVAACGKPYILLDFYSDSDDSASIVSDNCFDCYRMTKYLIERGHESIGFIGSVFENSGTLDRYLGYHRALVEYSVAQRPEWVIPDRKNGVSLSTFELPATLPQAFVCESDDSAYRLMEQLRGMGVSVPDDVSVVGYDDSAFAVMCEPKLTTCRVDTRKMSDSAVKTLLAILEGSSAFSGRLLAHGKIIERESVLNRKTVH